MAHAEWKFLLGNSDTMEIIGELRRATSRQLSVGLNRPGSASCNLRPEDALAKDVWPWETFIAALRNDSWIWSGPVTSVNTSLPAGQTTISAIGWFEILNRRFTWEALNFNDDDAGSIALDLLDHTNSEHQTGIIRGSVNQTTQNRDRQYVIDTGIGSSIQELSDVESGFDYSINPQTRVMDIWNRIGDNRPDVVFGYNRGPRNCASFDENIDGSSMVNDLIVRGRYASARETNVESVARHGMIQERTTLSDVVDPAGATSILGAYAVAEMVYRGNPRVLYSFKPLSHGAPEPFEDYFIGDTVMANALYGRVDVEDQEVRVFNLDLGIENNGLAVVNSMQTALG